MVYSSPSNTHICVVFVIINGGIPRPDTVVLFCTVNRAARFRNIHLHVHVEGIFHTLHIIFPTHFPIRSTVSVILCVCVAGEHIIHQHTPRHSHSLEKLLKLLQRWRIFNKKNKHWPFWVDCYGEWSGLPAALVK